MTSLLQDSEIKKIIEDKLPGAQVSVRDMTGTKDHWEVWVIASQFEGKSLLEQHRTVKSFFDDGIASGSVHALSLKTYTPEQWSEWQKKNQR